MTRHSRRSVPAVLVALALLAASVLTAVSCIQLLLGDPPLLPLAAIAKAAGNHTWNQSVVLAGAGLVTALGLVLLCAALIPGAPTVLGLDRRQSEPEAGATRRSLDRALTLAARDVDGVAKAAVRIKRRTITATVRTPLHEAATLPEHVHTAITDRLDDIALAHRPRLRIRTKTAKGT